VTKGQYFQPAKFIIDASGQSALLARNLNIREWDESFHNLAVYGYFSGAKRLETPNENNIFIESYQNGWVWSIPLSDGTMSVGVVVDSEDSSSQLQKTDPSSYLLSELSLSPKTSAMLSGANLTTNTKVVKDWSYTTSKMAGNGWVLTGDAACFIDPLFSSGVHLAMMSGVLASAYAVTYLKNTVLGEESASVYEATFRQEYDHFRDLALLFYSSNRTVDSYFWETRRLFKEENYFSDRSSFIRAVSGQSVRGYERVALERGELPNEFMSAINLHNEKSKERNANLLRIHDSISLKVPSLSSGAKLERKPVLSSGEFEWGMVITTPFRKEGVPCSNLVANLLMKMDGEKSLINIVDDLANTADESTKAKLLNYSIEAISILYVEGVIDSLS
ncbi:tryptophan 7-halogenase, partial [Chloroflexi bacterium]|nr:tryptophan 7-halogenase [Chloroflexota bacterium]